MALNSNYHFEEGEVIISNSFPQKDQLLYDGQLMEGQLVLFSVTANAGRTTYSIGFSALF